MMFVMMSDGNMMMIEACGKLRKEDLIGGLVRVYPGFLLVQLSWKRCFGAVEASEFTLTTIIIIIQK